MYTPGSNLFASAATTRRAIPIVLYHRPGRRISYPLGVITEARNALNDLYVFILVVDNLPYPMFDSLLRVEGHCALRLTQVESLGNPLHRC